MCSVVATYHLNVPYSPPTGCCTRLANKLMANAARITVRLKVRLLLKEKTVLTGNPFRAVVAAGDKNRTRKFFGLRRMIF